ncbi:MAG: protein-(glutamine-N5) methyltransferase, release factor-specific [Piscirickettsiaceae bacterium]|nr:MAG: protein-(glutamine-N5) methyltransferase, release factor-specific [Piscirickettsiaceae bacterium]
MSQYAVSIKDALLIANTQLVNSDSDQLDSEVLLAYVLKDVRTFLRAWPEKLLTNQQRLQYMSLIDQRKHGQPVAYLTGEREFWSHTFHVNSSVLIPRPDTELLIETVLNTIDTNKAIDMADLGTGSGAIAICLGLEYPHAVITAVDQSSDALVVAEKNAKRLHCHNVRFLQSNWFDNLDGATFDIIISNPPYIDKADQHLQEGDVRYEPKAALIAGEHGLQDIGRITSQAKHWLKDNGFLLLEHGFEQSNQVKTLLESHGYQHIQQFRDIQGHLRATLCQFNHS